MSDYGEIASLVARLAWMVDHEEYDQFMDYWTEDAKLRYVTVDGSMFERHGREIIDSLRLAYAAPESKCLHIPTSPVIDIDGDTARVRYQILHTLMGPQARPLGVEECDTQVRKCADGRWRVASLHETQLLAYDRIS